jgi:hypothetical protein
LARCAECRRSRLNPKLKKFPRFENTPLLALANDAELQAKARTLLSPPSIRFNDVMEDFIAEMLAAQYLQSLVHTEIRFLSEDDPIHTDLQSRCADHICVTEAKNLREPLALTKVEFSRWNPNRAALPERYEFMADLADLDDPLSDLTSEQEAAVVALIDELPDWNRPSHRIRDLPGGRRISARVSDGRSLIVTQGGGGFFRGRHLSFLREDHFDDPM